MEKFSIISPLNQLLPTIHYKLLSLISMGSLMLELALKPLCLAFFKLNSKTVLRYFKQENSQKYGEVEVLSLRNAQASIFY